MKKSPFFSKTALLLFTCLHACATFAGSPSRPYLIWVNLHEKDRTGITKIIGKYVDSLPGDEFCDDSAFGWIIYNKSRPADFTDDLVRNALDQRSDAAKRSITKKLQSFRAPPDIDSGMDGIIAYSEKGKPHMISIDAIGIIKKSKTIESIDNPKQVVDAFCSVMPEIYRK